MKHALAAVALFFTALVPGCASEPAALEIQPGSEVTIERKDGARISGRLIDAAADRVVVEAPDGERTAVPRGAIAAIRTVAPDAPAAGPGTRVDVPASTVAASRPPAAAEAPAVPRAADRREDLREVTIPAGTTLRVTLDSAVASDASRVEDPVRGTLREPVRIGGVEALPAGTRLHGTVTAAERSARVKGRARIAFRFTAIDPPGDAERTPMRSEVVSRLAPATKKQDAAKIGGGAVGGAIVGGLVGGGDGAAKGAAIGGAAGTGVVLATRGKEVRLGPGARLTVRLAAPLTLRVPLAAGQQNSRARS